MAFGALDGYPFTAEKLEAGNSRQFVLRFMVNGSCKAAAKNLNAQKISNTRWYAEGSGPEGGVLAAAFNPPTDFYARSGFHTLLHAAVAELAAKGLAVPENCPLCGLGNCDSYAFLDNEWRPVHRACLDTRLDLPETDFTPAQKPPGRIATGILGALAGALVAGVLIWALAMSNNNISWALYAFIPILSGLMYRTCRGKADSNIAALCVLGASLLVTLLLEQVWYQLVLSAEFGRNLPFSITIPTYFQAHSFASAIKEMMRELLAMIAGFVATSIILRRYAAEALRPVGTVRGSRFIRRTAQPIHPAGEPEADAPTPAPAATEASQEETQP